MGTPQLFHIPYFLLIFGGHTKMPKYIVVAGGVMSGVGKGVTTASIGKIQDAKRLQGNLK